MPDIDASLPIKVSAILIKGNGRTKEVYFQNEFSDSVHCQNVGELHEHLSFVTQNLQQSGLFEAVQTNIKVGSRTSGGGHVNSYGGIAGGPTESSAYDITVDVTVKEVGIPQLKMESYIQTGSGVNSGGGALQASIRNPLGYGEVTRVSLGSNTAEGQECSLITTIPHIRIPDMITPILEPFQPIQRAIFGSNKNNMNNNDGEHSHIERGILQLSLKKTEENPSHFVSFKSLLHTIGAEYASEQKTHTISTELTMRSELPLPYKTTPQLSLFGNLPQKVLPLGLFTPKNEKNVMSGYIPHAKTASQEILSNMNSSSKTSIQYTYLKDNRTPSNPILGSYLKSSIELALPTGVQSAQFLRTDLTAQTNLKVPLFHYDTGMIASFSGTLGALLPLPVTNQFKAFLTDRYHAGGPMSLRGFGGYGIGPRAPPSSPPPLGGSSGVGDSFGGFAKSSFLGTLSVPLDLKCLDKNAARAFFFINAGSIGMGFKANPTTDFTSDAIYGGSKYSDKGSKISPTDNTNAEKESTTGNVPFFGYLRASVGAGISLSLSPAITLEATYSVPILKSSHDVIKPFQLGVGLSLS